MKTLRVISLTLWTLALTVLIITSLMYFVLSYSLLDSQRMKSALTKQGFYASLRTHEVIPTITDNIAGAGASLSDNGPLAAKDVSASLESVFTEDKVVSLTNPVIDNVYQWLDKKQPTIDFSLPLTQEKQQVLQGIQTRLEANLKALPKCSNIYNIPESPQDITCLPIFASVADIRDEIMVNVTTALEGTDDAVAPTTVGLDNKQLGTAQNLPDYVSYLWTLNLITLPLAGLISLYLLIKRRGAGLLAIGVALLINGAAALAGYVALSKPFTQIQGETVRVVLQAMKTLLEPILQIVGVIGIISGIVLVILGILWRKHSMNKLKEDHFTADDEGDSLLSLGAHKPNIKD